LLAVLTIYCSKHHAVAKVHAGWLDAELRGGVRYRAVTFPCDTATVLMGRARGHLLMGAGGFVTGVTVGGCGLWELVIVRGRLLLVCNRGPVPFVLLWLREWTCSGLCLSACFHLLKHVGWDYAPASIC
jgi:hypothetical protein